MNKNNNFWKRKNIIKLLILGVLSIVISLGISLLQDSDVRNFSKQYYSIRKNGCQQLSFDSANMELKDSHWEGNEIVTDSEDPQIILSGIQSYIYDLTVHFAKPIEENTVVQVYFPSGLNGYSEKDSIKEKLEAGDTEFTVRREFSSSNIRVDIGEAEGLRYEIKSVTMNGTVDSDVQTAIAQNLSKSIKDSINSAIFLNRIVFCMLLCVFLSAHAFVNITKMYQFIFAKRWIIAGILLVLLVAGQYHGDSSVLYDIFVQPGEGSDYIEPVLGKARGIRSDEWVVETPRQLSIQYLENSFGKYNDIVRGTKTLNDLYINLGTLGSNPFLLAWLVLGVQYGFCFSWFCKIFLSFLLTLEWFMILTKRKKLLSTVGAFLIICSSFFMWWGLPGFIFSMHGALVCVYYFIHCEKRWQKVLLGIATPILTAYFINNLYPAWQVPAAYIVLIFLIWLVKENWEHIKKLKLFDWTVFGIALAGCGVLVVSYMSSRAEYTQAIINTVYPGSRISTGGFNVTKLYYYVQAWMYPFKEHVNASEAGVFLSFFPVPLLLAAYYWLKKRGKDFLLGGLLVLSIGLLIFTTVGFPEWLAKCTMLSYSPSFRAVDILGLLQVYLLILVLSKYNEKWAVNPWVAGALSVVCTGAAVKHCYEAQAWYFGKVFMVASFVIFTVLMYLLIVKTSARIRKLWCVAVICLCIITGATVRPIVKGFDSIYSKPVASEISKLAQEDKEGKWIAIGQFMNASFSVSCGAPTINFTNTYPNMELWSKLDPSGSYEEIYNRYAHVSVEFTSDDTTEFHLLQEDYIEVKISHQDLEKTDVKFVFAVTPLDESNEYFSLEELYGEYDAYIYRVVYH